MNTYLEFQKKISLYFCPLTLSPNFVPAFHGAIIEVRFYKFSSLCISCSGIVHDIREWWCENWAMVIITLWIDEVVKLVVEAVVHSATVVSTFSNHELYISVLHDQILLHFLDWWNIRIFNEDCGGCLNHSILVSIGETFHFQRLHCTFKNFLSLRSTGPAMGC